MLCRSVLVTGSNRGLGLEFIKQLAQQKTPPDVIIATCRSPSSAGALKDLAETNRNVKIAELDVGNEESYGSFVNHVKELVGSDGLNLLINNAGVSPKSTRINMVKWEQMTETLHINTIAPLMLTKALLPLLRVAADSVDGSSLSVQRAAVINLSSVLGSIAENEHGGLFPYRASKAALNAISKSLSLDLRRHNILVASLHPGWVKTDMGGRNAPLTPTQSISSILNTLYNMTDDHTGKFFQYDGKSMAW